MDEQDQAGGIFANIQEPEWVPVDSSNVEAIRWQQGHEYPLEVKFLAKGRRPSSVYSYQAPHSVYQEMLDASSKGQFVWHVLRADGYSYRRLS